MNIFPGLTKEQLKNPLIDSILGCIYGNALGDAFGLSTEFMSKNEINKMYKNKQIPFPKFLLNDHNKRWMRGDWTDDTDQMILIMETITETGQVDIKLFANKLKKWIQNGFPELGDKAGMGLGKTVSNVCDHPSFLNDPHKASFEIFKLSGGNAAANGALMRTCILGCYQYDDIKKVIENTINIAKVTHSDPRCLASCLMITIIISWHLQNSLLHQSPSHVTIEKYIEQSIDAVHAILPNMDLSDFNNYTHISNLSDANLDDSKAMGYTYKCMASGLYGLRSCKNFKTTLHEIVLEGGDSDTNGAVCGALWGLKMGYSQLPEDWLVSMPYKNWLDLKVSHFLKVIGLC